MIVIYEAARGQSDAGQILLCCMHFPPIYEDSLENSNSPADKAGF